MRAVVVSPPAKGARWEELPEAPLGARELRIRVLECGVCGTDREIWAGEYGVPPVGRPELILGHESLGSVAEIGTGVTGWTVGDLVVATVRRGCGRCRFCQTDQSDFCETGEFTERGIRGRDGFLSESYVERPEHLVKVPVDLRRVAVLLEPLSIVEKAVSEGRKILDRRGSTPGFAPSAPRALVAGTGAIGMLATFLLRVEGFEVVAIDRHGAATPAAGLLARIGAEHIDAAGGLGALGTRRFELVLEATGSSELDGELLPRLDRNGVLVLTGIPSAIPAPVPTERPGALRALVLENQAIVGSVNANRRHFERGLRHLLRFQQLWGEALGGIITERRPASEISEVLAGPPPGGMKSVVVVADR
jgi:threonine dehydrogenase-like Zn-dependent dehydrogenase